MNEIIISVVTACYNHGEYVIDAVNSVRNHKWSVLVEHIIVNDGSTDTNTVLVLNELEKEGIIVIHQNNAGPANARNTGISNAKGKYILPLDSDNRLLPEVFEKALAIIEADEDLAAVYTDAKCFGAMEYDWKPGVLDSYLLLARNHIDTCALIKKTVLIELGCFDDKIPVHGNEDWDLWLKMLFNKKKLYYLQQPGYEYRVIKDSLSRRESTPKQMLINTYIVKKYPEQYWQYYEALYKEHTKFENLKKYLKKNKLKSIIKIMLNKPLIDY